MPVIHIIIIIAVVGVILWVITRYVPMDAGIKKLLQIAGIVFLIIWLVKVTGLWGYISTVRV